MTGNAWAGSVSVLSKSGRIYNLPDNFILRVDLPDGDVAIFYNASTDEFVYLPEGMVNLNQIEYFTCNGIRYYIKDINTQNAYSFFFDKECVLSIECREGYYVDNQTYTIKDKCIKKPDAKNTTTKTESESQAKKTDNKSKEEKKKESSKNTTTKTDKKKKKSAENPVTPAAEADGATDADNEKETNPSGEDANETPAATENGNGTAAAGNNESKSEESDDGDTSTESADDESNEDEKQKFDFSKLDKILDEYFSDSSNWKNEDGNFNTARLVSDSVAGVVLGTAGGVITSKIIKKNQIKKGFEDLKCTVGGQEVATYGDEFTVGAKQ